MVGATPGQDGAHFRIWAPEIEQLELILQHASGETKEIAVPPAEEGERSLFVPGAAPGDRYSYRVNGQGPFPDPCSRYQPEGVHGPSEIIDPYAYDWHDQSWESPKLESLTFYELHTGTFTPEGNFQGIINRLPYLVDLGVTAIELMPVGDFPGSRNWGYDGVSMYAPARCYGRPDDLRRLVDEAHQQGLAVFLDVVYNHFGPDGNYTGVYSPYYVSSKHKTPWGDSLNFDDQHAEHVRRFFISNAIHWLQEYHFDGLRLDATHAIHDQSKKHFIAELTETVRATCERPVILIAEDHRNQNHMMKPLSKGGWGLDGVWADDYHHQNRCLLAGDSDGYFRDFRGTTADLAITIRQGWFFTGQYSTHLDEPRGSDPMDLTPPCFVISLQTHDQIGNRAFGERLHHQIDLAAWRAASAMLLCGPQTPLLFMGQEWAASTPFLFFTDHNEELGHLVTQGRREEFKHFKAFADPKAREKIPDPQAESTFEKSRLDWNEQTKSGHLEVLCLYRALLQLRKLEPALQKSDRDSYRVVALNEDAILLRRLAEDGDLLIVCQYQRQGTIDLAGHLIEENSQWQVLLTTEDSDFASDPRRPDIDTAGGSLRVKFHRPSAVIFKQR